MNEIKPLEISAKAVCQDWVVAEEEALFALKTGMKNKRKWRADAHTECR